MTDLYFVRSEDQQAGEPSKKIVLKYDLQTEAGLQAFNSYLEDHSYVEGYVETVRRLLCKTAVPRYSLSQADLALLSSAGLPPSQEYPHVRRWYNHVNHVNTCK